MKLFSIRHFSFALVFLGLCAVFGASADTCTACFLRKAGSTDPETSTHLGTYSGCLRTSCSQDRIRALAACGAAVRDAAVFKESGFDQYPQTSPEYARYYKAAKQRYTLCSKKGVMDHYQAIERAFSR